MITIRSIESLSNKKPN